MVIMSVKIKEFQMVYKTLFDCVFFWNLHNSHIRLLKTVSIYEHLGIGVSSFMCIDSVGFIKDYGKTLGRLGMIFLKDLKYINLWIVIHGNKRTEI